MFAILLLSVYSCAFVISSSVESKPSEQYIDGKQYTIKGLDTIYRQHVSNHGQCTIEISDASESYPTLSEGAIVKIKSKWFKAEDCRLNRAYVASCGSNLFRQMRDLVCSYVKQSAEKKTVKRRQADDALINLIDRSYYGMCCQSACTVSEFLRYCPAK